MFFSFALHVLYAQPVSLFSLIIWLISCDRYKLRCFSVFIFLPPSPVTCPSNTFGLFQQQDIISTFRLLSLSPKEESKQIYKLKMRYFCRYNTVSLRTFQLLPGRNILVRSKNIVVISFSLRLPISSIWTFLLKP